MGDADLIISMKDLGKTYKNGKIAVEALKKVNFDIHKEEFVSIMGPSGSGKSTLMNIIGCLDKPTTGNYMLDGSDIASLNEVELAQIRNLKIGFVFQSFNLLPRINALQNVELPMVYAEISSKERKKRALNALERVGLCDRVHHKPNEMSGGQKQRVAIARALVNNPAIILADEPTGNLDSTSGEEVMAVFQDLNKEGVTIILVTHEPDIASQTMRVIKFRDGLLISDKINESPIDARTVLDQYRAQAN